MFGIFKKRKLKKTGIEVNRLVFKSSVYRILEFEKKGVPESEYSQYPLENLILFFAMDVANKVFKVAMDSENPNASANEIEKAAMSIIFIKAAKVSIQMAGLNNKELESVIIQNGLCSLINADLDSPSPKDLSILALSTNTYNLLQNDHASLIDSIGIATNSYLLEMSDKYIKNLVIYWQEITDKTMPYSKKDNPSQGIVYMKIQKYSSFDDWFNAHNKAAMAVNEALRPQKEGISLIDLLEKEPFLQAYQDLVDPIIMGKYFGEHFNTLDVGF